MEHSPPNRWRFQLILRALLVGLTIFILWHSPFFNLARRQREVVAAIEAAGGSVVYDYQRARNGALLPNAQPKAPTWLRAVLGDDFFCDVIEVDLNRAKIDDQWLARLNGLPKLQALNLAGTPVSDAGIESLDALTHLKRAILDESAVTNRSLAHLARFSPHLNMLSIGGAGVTDAGLAEIAKLDQLQTLILSRAAITDAGMQNLSTLGELQTLSIASAPITDRGLASLRGLQKLRRLFLLELEISDDGIRRLAALGSLQQLAVTRAKITDAGLAPLTQLKWLSRLELYDTEVTDSGVSRLAQAMPTCKISTIPPPSPSDARWQKSDENETADPR